MEVARRTGEAYDALRRIAPRILRSSALGAGMKRTVTTSYCYSRLLYNTGSWMPLPEKLLKKIDRFRVAAWRAELKWHNAGKEAGERRTDAEVWQQVRQCGSDTLLQMERLKHLGRVARSAPPFLKAIIQLTAGHDDSWAADARRDLHVLWELHRATAGSTAIAKMRDPTAAPMEWLQLMTERPETWKQAVGRLSRQAHAPKERPAVATAPVDEGVCLDCHQCFPSMAALYSHRVRVHGYRNPLRSKISGSICACCLMDFWTRDRVLYHIKRSRICSTFYELRVQDLPSEEVQMLDREAAAQQRRDLRAGLPARHATRPPVRVAGPIEWQPAP